MVRDSGTILPATQDQILLGDLAICEARLGQRRYHALLDFGAGPAVGELPSVALDRSGPQSTPRRAR